MTHKGTIMLETERLILRRFVPTDAEAMFRNWASDPEVTKFMTWPIHDSIETTRKVIESWVEGYENLTKYEWAIVLRSLGEPIGSIAAMGDDDNLRSAMIGYNIGKPWWGNGYTAEALTRIIKFLFEEVGLNRIVATHEPHNPSSGAVMRKAGMKFEAYRRQAGFRKEAIYDHYDYAILAEDYFGKTQKKSVSIGDISIDCSNPIMTRNFYAEFTGWEKREAYGCPALVGDNGLLMLFMGCDFEFTPPVWPEEPGKQQKQMHFNFQVDNLPSAVEEAIHLGATKADVQYGGEHFVTMLDPEAHPFCLCRK